ncbi:carbohydrate-binding domain-containing protein [Winogradskyella endarachnes]|uniref:Carbohydrate-binding domain-containing protein n=1 Tax=Winogradskyella endarachnes TaxID=2681965 RepID=A0A6L6U9N9_9FLAO|nr:carbohydrate-binding domain-containing protein [Winogradskyella endarachnes]MUU78226.1 carbohydrate-binding domain-containing protein [Winogradskyella endarachnes]
MKTIKINLKLLFAALIFSVSILTFSACSDDDGDSDSALSISDDITITDTNTSSTAEGDTDNTGYDEDDLVENATFDYTIQIVFSNTSATITNPVPDDVVITQDGADVTVDSSISKVAYEISGTTTDGMLKIYSDKKFKLTLSDLNITNADGPAINIQSSKTSFVILEGTTNLADAYTYSNIPDDEDAKATFFSEGQLVFSGTGELVVTGNYKHGITSDDYVRVVSGTITVSDAASDAIHTNDYIIVDGGTLILSANSDGMDCEEGYIIINDGSFNINTVDDGIVASYDIDDEEEPDDSILPNVTINGGDFIINTSEGEGIEAKGILTINDGTINISAYDDGLNTGGNLYINGGNNYVYSTLNDAIDSNSEIIVTGGTTIAIAVRVDEPDGSFDCDDSLFKVTGGTILGLALNTSFPTVSESTQNSVIFDGVNANQLLNIQSEDGTEALTYLVPYSVNTIIYSNAKLETGETYRIYTGGSVSSGTEVNGLYTSGTYSGGTDTGDSFSINSTVTQIGGDLGPTGEPNTGGPGGN